MTHSSKLAFCVFSSLAISVGFSSCSWYKPEISIANKCVSNEGCGEGMTCRNERCEDIYYPKRKIRQF